MFIQPFCSINNNFLVNLNIINWAIGIVTYKFLKEYGGISISNFDPESCIQGTFWVHDEMKKLLINFYMSSGQV